MYKLKNKLVQHKGRKKILIICLAAVLVLGGALAALEFTDKTHFLHNSSNKNLETQKSSDSRTAGQNTKGDVESDSNKGNSSSNGSTSTGTDTTTPEDNKSDTGSTVDPNTPLVAPTGNFVSNHSPNRKGTPHPSSMQSVCNTTPGASCTIIFTNGSTTRYLPAQTADKGGATYWTWDVKDIGLTEGSWTIQAKATLGSQVKTASDQVNLQVGS